MHLDLLRHGDTGQAGFRGRLDDPLTALGFAQMRAALKDAGPWDLVVSSPKQRCLAAAHGLASEQRIPLIVDERLRELDFGDWEGRSAAELMQTHRDPLTRFWQDPYLNTPPGGEALAHFEERVLTARDALAAQHRGQRVLLITHGGVIRMLLCYARGLPRAELLNLEVSPASLHRITL